jgi:zinc/manganese transport system substrate-binding protein
MQIKILKILLIFFVVNFTTYSRESINIVTSFTILKDFVTQITKGVDKIKIFNLVGEDLDPHIYEPKPQDAKILSKADIVYINGLGFEGWIKNLIKASGFKGEMVEASKLVKPRILIRENTFDPHAWHDVKNAIKYVEVITESLVGFDPENACIYEQNAKNLIDDLKILDDWIVQTFNLISENKRVVLTTHDAFWYFGSRYQIKFYSPVGISTDAEPSAQDTAKIIDLLQKQKIKAIFIENLANSRLIEEISRSTKTKISGRLFADGLSKSDDGNTYQKMMRHNTNTIKNAMSE